MRRSSVIILAIMLGGFGVIFAAGGSALRPLVEDAEASKDLTQLLESRGDLAEGTKARVSRLQAGGRRLATEGRGVLLVLSPSAGVLAQRHGLRGLTLRAAQECLGHFPGGRLEWVEVIHDLPEGAPEPRELRTLLRVDENGDLGAPSPALPDRLTPGA